MGIGGAALNPEVETFLRESGFPFMVGYGLTEAAPLLAGGPHGDAYDQPRFHRQAHTPGGDPHRRPHPETGVGEIQARGPNIMQGYLNDPEATRDSFTEDGWLKTGDLGRFDEAGNLHISGRSKSMIVLSNGENVYPEAIEHKINAYPFVVESLVIENRGMLEAWIYPDYEFVDSKTMGQSRTQRHQYIAWLFEEMRGEAQRAADHLVAAVAGVGAAGALYQDRDPQDQAVSLFRRQYAPVNRAGVPDHHINQGGNA